MYTKPQTQTIQTDKHNLDELTAHMKNFCEKISNRQTSNQKEILNILSHLNLQTHLPTQTRKSSRRYNLIKYFSKKIRRFKTARHHETIQQLKN